jgi:hypothetical protein
VGIRRDGTLWVVPAGKVWQEKRMQQFGGETNWRQVVRTGDDFLLLKGDGSLWWWSLGTNRWLYSQDIWPTVLDHPLLRLGTDSDWKEVAFDGWFVRSLARKGDGSTWQVVPQSGWGAAPTWERAADFDGVALQTLVVWGHACQAYIGAEGILEARVGAGDGKSDSRFRPLSPETNWVAATVAGNWLVALKKDGTLWKWNRGNSDTEETFFAQKPVRLGIHNDWVGLCTGYNHPVTMAADGSLWLWPGTDRYDWALMRPPKQPHLMGNVLNAPIN